MAEALSEVDTGYRPNVSVYKEVKDEDGGKDEEVQKAVALENLSIFSGKVQSSR
jgi:hypothetical protein